MVRRDSLLFACGAAALASACGSSAGEGALSLYLEPEATITDGIPAGSSSDAISDGWDVSFTKYVVSVGGVRVARSSDGAEFRHDAVHLVDLRALSASGFVVFDEPSMPAGRWDLVGYSLVTPDASAVVDPNVSGADRDAMVAGGCTYLIEGTLTKAGGQSCAPGQACRATNSVAFRLCEPANATFTDCAPSGGLPGVVVTAASSAVAALTLHGDHLFFSSFPAGAELVTRRAQWLADADVDGNDLVDDTDLLAIDTITELSQLLPSASYNVANAPGGAIVTARDYAIAHLRTQGHFQGEGECALSLAP